MPKDLIIYHANRSHGNAEYYLGKEICIRTDTTDQTSSVGAISSRTGTNNIGNSCVSLFASTTAPTSVRGMFRSYTQGQNVGIDNRELLWLRFGDENLFFATSATAVTTTSTAYVNDFTINYTFTEPQFVICMYNCSNVNGGTFSSSTTAYRGAYLRTFISTLPTQRDPDGATSHMYTANMATNGFGLRVCDIPAGNTNFIAQYRSAATGGTITLGRRQFVVIAIPHSKISDGTVERYFIEYSSTTVTTSSTSFVDDSQAILSFTTTTNRRAFIIYNTLISEFFANFGCHETCINVDGVDYSVSRACNYSMLYYTSTLMSNNVSMLYLNSLSSGTHTIKGRFRVVSGDTALITLRQMVVLLW